MHQLDMRPPIVRMFIGFGIIIGLVVAAVLAVLITVWFLFNIGLVATAIMYVVIAFMTTIALLVWQVRRYHAGFRSLVSYRPDHADSFGSTARYGNPHDHNFFLPRWKGNRPPPDPTMPDHLHKPPRW